MFAEYEQFCQRCGWKRSRASGSCSQGQTHGVDPIHAQKRRQISRSAGDELHHRKYRGCSHGNREMPVWGELCICSLNFVSHFWGSLHFRALTPQDQAIVRLRVASLKVYINRFKRSTRATASIFHSIDSGNLQSDNLSVKGMRVTFPERASNVVSGGTVPKTMKDVCHMEHKEEGGYASDVGLLNDTEPDHARQSDASPNNSVKANPPCGASKESQAATRTRNAPAPCECGSEYWLP